MSRGSSTSPGASRGLVFGTAAESYERFRLGYPDGVVDHTLAHARRPVRRALEIGAGTGKATRAFASRGIRVTALEPDPEMLAVLERETAGMPVEPVLSDLEGYTGRPVDLVYAAAAWHWTDPDTRCARAADLLAPGGALAVFGGPLTVADPTLQAAVAAATGEPLDDPAFRPPQDRDPDGHLWLDEELRACGRFVDVTHQPLGRQVVLPQQEYVGYLSTLSAYLSLPMEVRQEVLQRISEVVPRQVTVDLSVGLHLARRP